MRLLRKAAQISRRAHDRPPRRAHALCLLTLACLIVSAAAILRLSPASAARTPARATVKATARLGERVGVRAAGRGHPFVKLSDGRDLLADYEVTSDSFAAPDAAGARPLALASADFDEDGTPAASSS